jgi:hypothetical protein
MHPELIRALASDHRSELHRQHELRRPPGRRRHRTSRMSTRSIRHAIGRALIAFGARISGEGQDSRLASSLRNDPQFG